MMRFLFGSTNSVKIDGSTLLFPNLENEDKPKWEMTFLTSLIS